jgi:hypothetical protein
VADTSDRRLLIESIVFPPYRALDGVPGIRRAINRLQQRRYERLLKELQALFVNSPLDGKYRMSGGTLLGYHREGKLLPWDCWDIDFDIEAHHLPELAATIPLLLKAGWRQRVTWFNNDGDVAMVRLIRKFVGLDLVIAYDRDDHSVSWLFSKRDGVWLQAEVRLPIASTQSVQFLGLTWPAPDPIEPTLEAMYGQWDVPDPDWDYMTTSAIVDTRPWTRPDLSWP